MSLINKKYDVSELAEIGTNGFTAASFPQIRDAVASKMKEIYGNDIDLSSASADGQYVNMEALILNNVYRTLESLAKSLNPADASGKYLDILVSFSGAFRRQPTNSVAQLYVWNTGAADISPDQIVCMDKSGNEWVWYNPVDYNGQKTVTIPSMLGTPTNYVPYGPLEFRCKSFGSVSASGDPNPSGNWQTVYERSPDVRGGDIYQTIDAGNFQVYQKNAAIAGKDLESDSSLRSRRNLSFGISGATVQNSLIANLLDIEGVDDVWVFNNNTSGTQTMDDGVPVAQHDVYVVVWKDPSLSPSDVTFDEVVGSVIYDQLTPGVLPASATGCVGGVAHTYGISLTPNISTTMRWKQSSWQLPSIQVTGSIVNQSTLSTEQMQAILDSLITYFNNIRLDEYAYGTEASFSAQAADFRTTQYGLPTYSINSIKYLDSDSAWQPLVSRKLPLSRFNYPNAIVNETAYYTCVITGSNFVLYLNYEADSQEEPWVLPNES